jgi:hypothetical protein
VNFTNASLDLEVAYSDCHSVRLKTKKNRIDPHSLI